MEQETAPEALRRFIDEAVQPDGTRLTNEAFGLRVGVTDAYISMLKNSKCSPSRRLALRIETATDGAVPAALWEAALADEKAAANA